MNVLVDTIFRRPTGLNHGLNHIVHFFLTLIPYLLKDVATMETPSRSPHPETHTGSEIPKQDEAKLNKVFIGSVDQGTTSTRFLIFDGTGTPVVSHQIEFKQMYPRPGCVDNYISQV